MSAWRFSISLILGISPLYVRRNPRLFRFGQAVMHPGVWMGIGISSRRRPWMEDSQWGVGKSSPKAGVSGPRPTDDPNRQTMRPGSAKPRGPLPPTPILGPRPHLLRWVEIERRMARINRQRPLALARGSPRHTRRLSTGSPHNLRNKRAAQAARINTPRWAGVAGGAHIGICRGPVLPVRSASPFSWPSGCGGRCQTDAPWPGTPRRPPGTISRHILPPRPPGGNPGH